MNDERPSFNTGAVRPVECLREGWGLIKNKYWLFLGISIVGVLIVSAPMVGLFLVGPIMCGIYICLFRHERGQFVKFEMLFRGFDYFVQSLIATLIMIIPALVILVPAYVMFFAAIISQMPKQAPGAPPPPLDPSAIWTILAAFGLFFLVVMLVSIVLQVLFFFTYPLIVDRKLTGVQAIGASFRAAHANFGGVLGLVLLIALLGLVGVLACYVGAFFVLPIHFAAYAVAYRKVFPRSDEPTPDDPNVADYGPQLEDDAR
jgi:hypothetical protein